MTEVELIAGGYVFVAPSRRIRGMGTAVPEEFLTISHCLKVEQPRPEFLDWWLTLEGVARARTHTAPDKEIVTVAFTKPDAVSFMEEWGGAQQSFFELLRVNGHVAVPAGGHLKVPTLRGEFSWL